MLSTYQKISILRLCHFIAQQAHFSMLPCGHFIFNNSFLFPNSSIYYMTPWIIDFIPTIRANNRHFFVKATPTRTLDTIIFQQTFGCPQLPTTFIAMQDIKESI